MCGLITNTFVHVALLFLPFQFLIAALAFPLSCYLRPRNPTFWNIAITQISIARRTVGLAILLLFVWVKFSLQIPRINTLLPTVMILYPFCPREQYKHWYRFSHVLSLSTERNYLNWKSNLIPFSARKDAVSISRFLHHESSSCSLTGTSCRQTSSG